MRKVSRLLLLAALSAGPASAADLPVPPAARPVPVPMPAGFFSWTSWYAGAFVGGAWSRDASTSDPCSSGPPPACYLTPAGGEIATYPLSTNVIGGVTAGYNYQIPGSGAVFGIETEFSFLRLTGSSTFAAVSAAASAPFLEGNAIIGNWYNATTLRLGWAWDRLLFYAKGGFSIGTLEARISDSRGFLAGSGKNDFFIGWAWGGGVEWAVTSNWSVKGEYLWVGLDNTVGVCATAPPGTPNAGSTFCGSTTMSAVQTAKIGFNYLINAGPVYARY